MSSAAAFLQWHNYEGASDKPGLFSLEPLAYNCRQERLHSLKPGDHLWLVSRCPEDQQHYFVGLLHVASIRRNLPDSQIGRDFGEFAVVADRSCSRDFGRMFPAEGLLRAFSFESGKAVKTGAYLGKHFRPYAFFHLRMNTYWTTSRRRAPPDIRPNLTPRSASGRSATPCLRTTS
jgi:hypothetical protein